MTLSGGQNIVLVVDDAPETLSMLIDTLEEAGLTVLVARDGITAIALAKRVRPNVILMDAVMPELDGFETCRRLKSGPNPNPAPIIFMTGLSDPSHIVSGLRAGGVDYITKPVNTDELIARVTVHVANARLVDDARHALDAVGHPIMAVAPGGRIAWASDQAIQFADKLPGLIAERQRIADASLLAWLADTIDRPVTSVTPWSSGSGRDALTVTYVGRATSGDVLVRLSPDTVSLEERLKEKFGLTMREAEVLHWIMQGKSNRDIAEILTLNPGTVNKHLEKILNKLGVENRTAAAVLAMKAAGTDGR
ncbi:DNA-binding NarL/FixJ family response regulator [Amorphus suaedae]